MLKPGSTVHHLHCVLPYIWRRPPRMGLQLFFFFHLQRNTSEQWTHTYFFFWLFSFCCVTSRQRLRVCLSFFCQWSRRELTWTPSIVSAVVDVIIHLPRRSRSSRWAACPAVVWRLGCRERDHKDSADDQQHTLRRSQVTSLHNIQTHRILALD